MSRVQGYSVGDIQAEAAFTSEIVVNGLPALQDIVNTQDIHRKEMDARPGMYLKYLPHRYDDVTGELLIGGAYLFDTQKHAAEYWHWTHNVFEVDEPKTKFWSQPMFKSAIRFSWEVIGATNFAPVDTHAAGRFQRWSYEAADSDVTKSLQQLWPDLKKAVEKQGAAAVWLLHQPKEKQICIQLAFPKADGPDPLSFGHHSLARAANQASLDYLFPEIIKTTKAVDRTSLFMALWLPRSRLAGGAHQLTPMYPALPTVQG